MSGKRSSCNIISQGELVFRFLVQMRTVDFAFEIKVHIFWEGHKILRNLHITFVLCSAWLWRPSLKIWMLFQKILHLFFSFFLSGSRIESFLLMSFSSPTLAFTEYIEESWLYFQGHHQSQRLYISWYVSSVKNNLDFRIIFRYHNLLSLRTLKRKIRPNESLFSRYSLALRGFWKEKNRLLTFLKSQ